MSGTCETCGGPLPPRKRASGRRRRFCSERCRKAQYDRTCVDCGGRTSGTDTPESADGKPRCHTCGTAYSNVEMRARAEKRALEFLRLRESGLSNVQITERTGAPSQVISRSLARLARAGYAVPRSPANTGRKLPS